MFSEAQRRSDEELTIRRQVMAEHAAGSLAMSMEGINVGLLDHQVEAYQKGLRFVAEGDPGKTLLGHFQKPPGYGKSGLEVYHASGIGLGNPDIDEQLDEGLQALSLTPTSYLREQKAKSYAQFAPSIHFETRTTTNKNKAQVLGTTYTYVIRALRRGEFRPGQFDVIYYDEAHHMLGEVTLRALQTLQRGAANIGFTATPAYSEERTIASTLPNVISKTTLEEGILRDKFLSPVQLFSIKTGEYIRDYIGTVGGDYATAAIEHLAQSTDRNQAIVNAALHALGHTHGKGIVKCVAGGDQPQAHARAMAEMLSNTRMPGTERNIRAVAVGNFNPKTPDIIERFRITKEIDVLTYVDVVGEGVDIPDLAWGVFGAPTRSKLNLMQFLGRGTRPKDTHIPFLMYQILDEAHIRPDQLVHAWSLFGLKSSPEQGWVIAPDVGSLRLPPPLPHNPPKHKFGRRTLPPQKVIGSDGAAALYDIPQLTLSTEVIPPDDLSETHFALDELQSESGLEPEWLRRILAYEGHGTIVTPQGDDIRYYIPYEAKSISERIATPEDVLYDNTAEQLGIAKGTFGEWLWDKDPRLQPVLLYPREPARGVRRVRHFTPEQIEALRGQKRHEINESHILISEIAERLGRDPESTRSLLNSRRFESIDLDPQKEKKPHHRNFRTVYERAVIEPWLQAYENAQPAPETGFTKIRIICKHRGLGIGSVIPAALAAGVPLACFTDGTERREEYVANEHIVALEQVLKGLKSQAAKKTASKTAGESSAPSEVQGPIRPSKRDVLEIGYFRDEAEENAYVSTSRICNKLARFDILHHQIPSVAAKYGIRSKRLNENGRPSWHMTVKDADAFITRFVEENPLMQPKQIQETVLRTARKFRCSTGVIKYLIHHHPLLEDYTIQTDEENHEYITEKTYEVLEEILAETINSVKPNWIYAGATVVGLNQSTHDLHKTHPEFKRQILQKSISIPNKGEVILVYCTPEAFHAVKQTRARDAQAAKQHTEVQS